MIISRRLFLSTIFSASLSLTLSGCGYQLRGSQEALQGHKMPFRKVLLTTQGTDGELVKSLSMVLRALDCEIVDKAEQAEVELLLEATGSQVITSAIGSYGEIAARLYIMTQVVKIRKVGVDAWVVDTVIRRSREVDQSLSNYAGLGAERPLAITRESEEVMLDIRARIVDAIVRQFQRLAPLESVS